MKAERPRVVTDGDVSRAEGVLIRVVEQLRRSHTRQNASLLIFEIEGAQEMSVLSVVLTPSATKLHRGDQRQQLPDAEFVTIRSPALTLIDLFAGELDADQAVARGVNVGGTDPTILQCLSEAIAPRPSAIGLTAKMRGNL